MLSTDKWFMQMTRELGENETIKQKDYIEWSRGAWTTIDKGSIFIGKKVCETQPGLRFRRKYESEN